MLSSSSMFESVQHKLGEDVMCHSDIYFPIIAYMPQVQQSSLFVELSYVSCAGP